MTVKDPRKQNIRPITAKKVLASNTPQVPVSRNVVDAGAELLKGILSPLYTMAARPFQAGAELAGVSDEKVNKFSEKFTGGLIAPTPQKKGDLKKEIGRAIETIALGIPAGAGTSKIGGIALKGTKLTPQAVFQAKLLSNVIADSVAGSIFGAGYGLEQGEDLKGIAKETAKGGVVAGVGGQVLRGIGRTFSKKPVAPQIANEVIPENIQTKLPEVPQKTTRVTKQLELTPQETRTIQKKLVEEEPKFSSVDPEFQSGTFEKFKADYEGLKTQNSVDDMIDIVMDKKPNPTSTPKTAIYELLKKEKTLTIEQKMRLANRLPESKAGQELVAVKLRDNSYIFNNDVELLQAVETKLKDKALKNTTRKTLGKFLDDLECK